MTDTELSAIEAQHYLTPGVLNALGHNAIGQQTLALVAEVRRLRAEKTLLEETYAWLKASTLERLERLERLVRPESPSPDKVDKNPGCRLFRCCTCGLVYALAEPGKCVGEVGTVFGTMKCGGPLAPLELEADVIVSCVPDGIGGVVMEMTKASVHVMPVSPSPTPPRT